MNQALQKASLDNDAPEAPRRWRFGEATLDERTLELTVGGRAVALERRPLEVLLFMLRHAGEALSKEQFFEAVWGGRILTEQVLTQSISKLREALGPDGATIKTVHGHGYRLVATVQSEPAAPPAPESSTPGVAPLTAATVAPPPSRRNVPMIAFAATALVAALLAWIGYRGLPVASNADKSVAILPFENLSAEPDSRYFTDGLHDSVITQIAGVRDLRVISRTSVLPYRDGQRPLREIAEQLGVAHLVEGSVQRVGNRLRVHAQLIDTRTDAHVWAAEYDRDLRDVFAVQAEIAQQIARAVRAELRPEEKTRIEKAPTQDLAAYDLYVRALELYRANAGPTPVFAARAPSTRPEPVAEAIALLEQAVGRDPDFAAAHALLSRAHDLLYWYGFDPSEHRLRQVRDAAQAAFDLDPELAQAHLARGAYLFHGARDYPAAIEALQQARRLAPGDAEVHSLLATLQRRQGAWDDALAGFAMAARLDPRNESALEEHALTLNSMRRYADADAALRKLASISAQPAHAMFQALNRFHWTGDVVPLEETLERMATLPDPTCQRAFMRARLRAFRRDFIGGVSIFQACPAKAMAAGGALRIPTEFFVAQGYRLAGDAQRAQEYYRRTRGPLEEALRERPDQPRLQIPLAFALVNLGERDQAMALAERASANIAAASDGIADVGVHGEIARFYASVGETERALDELTVALTVPGGVPAHDAAIDPSWDSLRNDPRFKQLIANALPKP